MKAIHIFWARRWLFLFSAASVIAAVAVGLMLWPSNYTATARVLVDQRQTDTVSGNPMGGVFLPMYMATQVDVVRSMRVATKAVSLLKLEESPAARTKFAQEVNGEISFSSYWAEILLKRLDVRPLRESNVLELSYSGVDPGFAAEVANAFARAYIETSLELRVEPAKDSSQWFEERTRQFREELERAQGKLSAYQKRSGIISIDERLDVENARLQELSSQYVALQAQSVDASKRASSAEQSLKEGSAALPEVQSSSTIQTLKIELARMQGRESDLAEKLGSNHPQLISVRAEAEQIRQRIAAETALATRSIRRTSEVSNQREAQLLASLNSQKTKVLQLKRQRDELSVLQRDVESTQRSYDLLKQRVVQTTLESQSNTSNLAILDGAVVPRDPSSPRTLLTLMMACFFAPLFGFVAVSLAEWFDPRLRSEEDLAILGNVRLLAVVPEVGSRSSRFAMLRRVTPFALPGPLSGPNASSLGGPSS